jgi:hypothetical protein
MTTFADLPRSPLLPAPDGAFLGEWQKQLDALFPPVVAASPLRLGTPGEAIQAAGRRLLIGVATWSQSDLQLLDTVADALLAGRLTIIAEVFNVADCRAPADFEYSIPGLGRVYQTPVAGLRSDGELSQTASGKAARELIARAVGLAAVALTT